MIWQREFGKHFILVCLYSKACQGLLKEILEKVKLSFYWTLNVDLVENILMVTLQKRNCFVQLKCVEHTHSHTHTTREHYTENGNIYVTCTNTFIMPSTVFG